MLLSPVGRRPLAPAKPMIVKKRKQTNPIMLLILAYLALISAGTALLSLPFCETDSVDFIDNLFVATSAVCVTGLTPIDVGTAYTHIGHWVIILLMQTGGLGIMVASTALILLAGMKPGFGYQSVFLDEFTHENISPSVILKAVLPFTFVVEAFGLGIYFWQFPELDTYDRFFSALFQTVSTFCNVGFSLYPDSLMQFETNPIVVFTTAILVIAGGFGFLAVMDLQNIFKKKKISLHTKLVSIMTFILLVVAFVAFLGLEFMNTLDGYSIGQKLLSSFSFSAISRTAGIGMTDISTLTSASLLLTLAGMFIGANPGSCGGGLKTTTAAVIMILGFNRLLGREKTRIFGRTIPQETVNKAVYIFLIAVIVITIATLLLLLSETWGNPYNDVSVSALKILFEATSAYATCGLSLGITPELSAVGRAIICLVMFIGRMGPLFLISAVASKDSDQGIWYSEENIMVG